MNNFYQYQIGFKVLERTRNRVGYQIDYQVGGQVARQVRDQMWVMVADQIGGPILQHIYEVVNLQIGERAHNI